MIKNRIISSLRAIITTMLFVLANIAAIYLVDYISADFSVGLWYNAIIIVIAVAIANSLLWPIFRRFLMKIIIFTFGIGSLFINSIIFYIASYFIERFDRNLWHSSSSNHDGNSYHIHYKHYKHQLLRQIHQKHFKICLKGKNILQKNVSRSDNA